MKRTPRFNPVRVIRNQTDEIKTVSTTDAVWKILLDDWPLEEGNCFLSALLICLDVQHGERPPEEARVAFIAAAVEAGVRVLS